MVYIRRYLSGQQATTVTIAQGAITEDKIVDGAVTHPKVAPNAIDSERVINESLKSEDIKDGEIKTPDVQDGAITTPKIADGAVTTQKLEASIQGITRPLTPGVDTDEIQDAKVTLAKLAPDSVNASKIKPGAVGPSELAVDAVETSRVKDGAISTSKIAGSAVDQTKIAANAVTGSEILNRSVGNLEIALDGVRTENVKDRNITSPKINLAGIIPELIAPDAVETDKILDGAVTDPKLYVAALSRRHMNSLSVRESIFHEDFGGEALSNRWVKTGLAGGLVVPAGVNGLKIQTGPLLHDIQDITFGGNAIVVPNNEKPSMLFRLTGMKSPLELVRMWLGLKGTATQYIAFAIVDVGPNNMRWYAVTRDGGADTSTDTLVDAIDGVQHFQIDASDPTSIKFYINGALVATNTTNIPATRSLEPWFYLDAGEAVAKYIYLKEMTIMAEKPDWV